MENFTDYEQRSAEGRSFEEVASYIAEGFACEKIAYNKEKRERNFNSYYCSLQDLFEEWASGLPSILNCMYYYNVSAVDLLGDLLEQTKEERNKYSEQQAEKLLTYLIYKELKEFIYKTF